VPVIGINVGKLGFLAEFGIDEIKHLFDRVTADKSLIEKRMMLQCEVSDSKTVKLSGTAINDVVVNAGPPHRAVDLKITVGGQALADCISDGLIISTPTGSTAYNLSAGGPILSANLAAIVITTISPHSLSFRPIVISADSKVEIFPQRLNEGTAVTLDGLRLCGLEVGFVVSVRRHNGWFRVVNNPLRTQWDTLAEKLSWAQKPKYKGKES
jgi:NAD+ kinase